MSMILHWLACPFSVATIVASKAKRKIWRRIGKEVMRHAYRYHASANVFVTRSCFVFKSRPSAGRWDRPIPTRVFEGNAGRIPSNGTLSFHWRSSKLHIHIYCVTRFFVVVGTRGSDSTAEPRRTRLIASSYWGIIPFVNNFKRRGMVYTKFVMNNFRSVQSCFLGYTAV
jgi:hypothetical protein